MSRKISLGRRVTGIGAASKTQDIAKYFIPVRDIRLFMPAAVSF
jgi:hypothetical protein